MELDLERARRRAKELLRAARRGELLLRDDREPRATARCGERVEGYVAAARALLAAGASVTEGMAQVAAGDVAALLEEAEPRDAGPAFQLRRDD